MSKKEQLIEYCIQDIIEIIIKEQNVEYDKAMQLFYNSQTFEKLNDVETGLYIESTGYVYSLFQDEMNFGKRVQAEI